MEAAKRGLGSVPQWCASVTSTQDTVRAWAREGRPGGVSLVADAQTAGRGRLGRVWESDPADGVQLSMLLRPKLPPARLPLVSLALGVAVHDAVDSDKLWLKWPNDLLDADDKKVAGVLAEAEVTRGRVDHVIVGVGVNVTRAPCSVPTATSLRAVGVPRDRAALAVALVCCIDRWVTRLERDSAAVVEAWRSRSRLWGREVRVGNVEGVAESLDDDGALWLRLASGTRRRVLAGDVEMIKVEHR